jgi:hypothetical protein
VAGALTLFVIPGARIGSAPTMKSNDVRLRLAVALCLGVISVIYAAGELASLRLARAAREPARTSAGLCRDPNPGQIGVKG